MSEEKGIVSVETEGKIITPIISAENAEKAMQAYQQLCAAVLIPWDDRKIVNGVIVQESDYQRIPVRRKEDGKWITEYRDFPRKSAWRKLGKFYKISDEIVDRERVDREDGSFVWRYTVKAIAPDGQYTLGVGSCDSKEIHDARRREHDTESKAHTRAKNRATSDLIGFGQVSAEEMTGEPKHVEAKQTESNRERAIKVSSIEELEEILKRRVVGIEELVTVTQDIRGFTVEPSRALDPEIVKVISYIVEGLGGTYGEHQTGIGYSWVVPYKQTE